jgi:hypothetical protein
MTASQHSPSLALLIALSGAACILPDLSLEGLQCPCADGFTCDAATNTCVTGEGGSSSTVLPPDATSTGPSMGGTSGDGGTPSGPGGAPPMVGGAGGAISDGGFGVGGFGGEGSGGAPVVDGTCDSPIAIPDPGGVVSTTVGQGNDMPTSCYDAAGPDVVYTVTAAITGTMQLTLYSQAELFFYARTDCLDGSADLFCVDDNGTNAFEVATLPVTSGQTIYVIVDGHGGEESDFTLDVATSP